MCHILCVPSTTINVCSYYHICVVILLSMCAHTTTYAHTPICVSSYYYICVLILRYVSSYYYICPHTTTYVSSYSTICVLNICVIFYMCPHTAIYVSLARSRAPPPPPPSLALSQSLSLAGWLGLCGARSVRGCLWPLGPASLLASTSPNTYV